MKPMLCTCDWTEVVSVGECTTQPKSLQYTLWSIHGQFNISVTYVFSIFLRDGLLGLAPGWECDVTDANGSAGVVVHNLNVSLFHLWDSSQCCKIPCEQFLCTTGFRAM